MEEYGHRSETVVEEDGEGEGWVTADAGPRIGSAAASAPTTTNDDGFEEIPSTSAAAGVGGGSGAAAAQQEEEVEEVGANEGGPGSAEGSDSDVPDIADLELEEEEEDEVRALFAALLGFPAGLSNGSLQTLSWRRRGGRGAGGTLQLAAPLCCLLGN